MKVQENEINTEDSYIYTLSANSYKYKAIAESSEILLPESIFFPLAMIEIELSRTYKTTTRSVYNLLDVFGDFGGVSEVFLILSALIIAPIADHLFLIKAIKKLYLANTTEDDLFVKSTNPKQMQKKKR